MDIYEIERLADHAVLRGLKSVVARNLATTAEMLAFIAVATERRLYLPEGYSSMFAYCMGELKFSEDETFKRTQAAGAARRFPVIFGMLADGRLHLTAVCLLAPHLTPENAAGLLAAATNQTKRRIECVLAEYFPTPDVPALVQAIASGAPAVLPAPEQVKLRNHAGADALALDAAAASVPETSSLPAPEQVKSASQHAKLTPIAPQRFSWQLTVSASTNDKLQYARQLLGHAVPSGEVAEVLDRALDALLEKLEKRVFAASSRPRPARASRNPRQVPADVMRKVWARDGGQCRFVSAKGHRCEARTRLEFDHVNPVARGGDVSPKNLRLLCRAHNQHAAECSFGKGFMRRKREAAQHTARQKQTGRAAAAEKGRSRGHANAEALVAAAQELVP